MFFDDKHYEECKAQIQAIMAGLCLHLECELQAIDVFLCEAEISCETVNLNYFPNWLLKSFLNNGKFSDSMEERFATVLRERFEEDEGRQDLLKYY